MNRKRKKNESYNDYKSNLKAEDFENKQKLKGKVFHDSFKNKTYYKPKSKQK